MTDRPEQEPAGAQYQKGSPFKPKRRKAFVRRTFPLVQELRQYSLSMGRADGLAGLTVAALAVPAAMAYAELAGLLPVVGLYALLLPAAAYAMLGTSRPLSIGPEGGVSALVAAAMPTIPCPRSPRSPARSTTPAG